MTYVLMDDVISVYVDICLLVGSLFSDTSDGWKVENLCFLILLMVGKWKTKQEDNTF